MLVSLQTEVNLRLVLNIKRKCVHLSLELCVCQYVIMYLYIGCVMSMDVTISGKTERRQAIKRANMTLPKKSEKKEKPEQNESAV